MNRIYLDNAATTPIDPEVIKTMTSVLTENFGNPSAQHSFGRNAKGILESARKTIANLIGAQSNEIYFTSTGTEADNMAIRCSVYDLGVKTIITSPTEHHAVINTCNELEGKGLVKVLWVNLENDGRIDLHSLSALAMKNPGSLISLMHANNEMGALLDIKRVSEIAEQNDCFLHSDTVQTMGHYAFDLSELKIDFLACSAHKFNGPKGVGFLYMNNRIKAKPLITGGGQERSLRAGTENISGIAGMAKALEICFRDLEEDHRRMAEMKSVMANRLLAEIPGVQITGPSNLEQSLYTVLNVSFPPNPISEMFIFKLDIEGVCASGGSACSSGASKGSHVLAAMKFPEDRTAVRFSFGKFNTLDDINQAVDRVKSVLQVETIPVLSC